MAITGRAVRRPETALVSLILGLDSPSRPLPASAAAETFYVPPAALPPGEPGDALRVEPTTVSLLPGLPLPATDSWRLTYRSTAATGEPMTVTGTLMVPRVPWPEGERPLVSFAAAGHGMGRQCTPSVQFHLGTQFELAVVTAHLAQGCAVVVTDYQRAPAFTYLNAASSAHAVLDAARAAPQVAEAGLPAAGPVGITGYAHGGTAAAAAAERQPTYAPELDLRGVAAGGVVADLAAVLRAVEGQPRFGIVPMALASLRSAYAELTLDGLSPTGRRAVRSAAGRCTPDVLVRWAGRGAAELTAGGVPVDRFLDGQPAWQARVDQQRIGRLPPEAPVLLYHGLGEPWLPYDVTRRLARDWRARGAEVHLSAHPVVEHGGALVETIPPVRHWLGARLAGR